jgi:hypothetical protein
MSMADSSRLGASNLSDREGVPLKRSALTPDMTSVIRVHGGRKRLRCRL